METFRPTGRRGFTLIEIFCVLVIVAILASLTIYLYPLVFGKAEDMRRKEAGRQQRIEKVAGQGIDE